MEGDLCFVRREDAPEKPYIRSQECSRKTDSLLITMALQKTVDTLINAHSSLHSKPFSAKLSKVNCAAQNHTSREESFPTLIRAGKPTNAVLIMPTGH
jgi:hypothetical protein